MPKLGKTIANVIRGDEAYAPVRVSGYRNAEKTHCWRGHPFTGENLLVLQNGRHRVCRTCQRIRHENYIASEHGQIERKKAAIKYRQNNAEKIRERNHLRTVKGRKFIESIKDNPCLDCGNRYPSCAMDLDHVKGKKKNDLSRMCDSGYTLKALMEEVNKCELVCANCHRIRENQRRQSNGN